MADWEELLTPTGGVVSIFGRSGAVTAQSCDYTFAQIGSTSSILSGLGTGSTFNDSTGTARAAAGISSLYF